MYLFRIDKYIKDNKCATPGLSEAYTNWLMILLNLRFKQHYISSLQQHTVSLKVNNGSSEISSDSFCLTISCESTKHKWYIFKPYMKYAKNLMQTRTMPKISLDCVRLIFNCCELYTALKAGCSTIIEMLYINIADVHGTLKITSVYSLNKEYVYLKSNYLPFKDSSWIHLQDTWRHFD